MDARQIAAHAALTTHDALRAANDSEPPLGDDGLPLGNAAEWLDWHENVSKPAYAAWDDAMHDLDSALGEQIGRHPFTFRPICEKILGIAAVREP